MFASNDVELEEEVDNPKHINQRIAVIMMHEVVSVRVWKYDMDDL